MNIQFDFQVADSWTMEAACKNPSVNPAPASNPVLYLIHNQNENTTYAGYAFDAQDRWKTRTEVFHCFGIKEDYAKKVLCAMCVPVLTDGSDPDGQMHGALNTPEHLLIRAVAKGLLGVTTSTNTGMAFAPYVNPYNYNKVAIYLPNNAPWGHLQSNKAASLQMPY